MKKLALSITLLALWVIEPVYAAEFFCASGDVTCLIAAINTANQNFQQNTINLKAGVYALTMVDNVDDDRPNNANGLPLITGKMTIRGQGSSLTTIERDSAFGFQPPYFRIFRIEPTGVLTLESLAVKRGFVGMCCGGNLFNLGDLTIVESDISEGVAPAGAGDGGGGILNTGNLVVRSSRIFDNDTGFAGGGILNRGTATIEDSFIFSNRAHDVFGGGILNVGELQVSRTNIVGNSSLRGGGLGNLGRANLNRVFVWLNASFAFGPNAGGGGIYNDSSMELNILSSTIAENTSETVGAGIFNLNGHVTITNSTIAGNRNEFFGFSGGVGAGIENRDQLEIQNSIVALNSAATAPDCSGSPLSLGRNIIGDPSGCQIILRQSDLTGDPGLGDLVVEDAPGRGYFPLLPNSPAINSANPDACPVTDQLGLPRVGICDIGSVEFQGGKLLVSIDIRPKSDANRINPASDKNVNVAIFSANGFDATTVSVNTVRFGATGNEAAPIHIAFNDANGDGQLDMVARFQIQDTGIKCGDTSAVLTGQIFGGASFIGSSPITTVQCGKQVNGLIASGLSQR